MAQPALIRTAFYVEGAQAGEPVCPVCHEKPSKFVAWHRGSLCPNPVHGQQGVQLVDYQPPQRPPSLYGDEWVRE
jgi:hypothetical protein